MHAAVTTDAKITSELMEETQKKCRELTGDKVEKDGR